MSWGLTRRRVRSAAGAHFREGWHALRACVTDGGLAHARSPGMDWDELEEQAKQDDRERHFSDEEGDDRGGHKRKGGGGRPAAAPSKKAKR